MTAENWSNLAFARSFVVGGVQFIVHISQTLIVDQAATGSFDNIVLVLVLDNSFMCVLALGAQLRDALFEPIVGSAGRVVFSGSLQLNIYVRNCVGYFGGEIRVFDSKSISIA